MPKTLLDIYIQTLVSRLTNIKECNIPCGINNPPCVDVVFDGGAFNGGMGLGVALYLKELERANMIRVSRVSGCSIGSIIALYYLTTSNYDINEMFLSISKCFKEQFDLTQYAVCVREFIFNNMTEDMCCVNNILHITYYDIVLGKQVVQNTFDSREHLLDCIIRSSHIPYISNKEFKYKARYLDGITPHVFRDDKRPVLFVMMVTNSNYHRVFNTKNETNVNERLLLGINDINTFISTGTSDMCSYYNEWSLLSILSLRARESIFVCIIIIIELYTTLYKFIPCCIRESNCFTLFTKISYSISQDIMYYLIN